MKIGLVVVLSFLLHVGIVQSMGLPAGWQHPDDNDIRATVQDAVRVGLCLEPYAVDDDPLSEQAEKRGDTTALQYRGVIASVLVVATVLPRAAHGSDDGTILIQFGSGTLTSDTITRSGDINLHSLNLRLAAQPRLWDALSKKGQGIVLTEKPKKFVDHKVAKQNIPGRRLMRFLSKTDKTVKAQNCRLQQPHHQAKPGYRAALKNNQPQRRINPSVKLLKEWNKK